MSRRTRRQLKRALRAPGLFLCLAILVILGLAFFLDKSPPEATAPLPAPEARAPIASLGVSPGAGIFSQEAPPATQDRSQKALCPGCDIVVISICSLRRDHLEAYGSQAPLTPHMDTLAELSLKFDTAYAASPFTLASLTSILTGRFPSSTGVTGWDKGLVANLPTLPEVLGIYGYKTAAFTIDAASGFRPDYGLDRGFQHMEISSAPVETPDGRRAGANPTASGASAAPAADWIRDQEGGPLFVMFHSRTAHFPFVISQYVEDSTGVRSLLWDDGTASPGGQAMPGMAGGTAARGVVERGGPDPLQAAVQEGGAPALESWRSAYAEAVTHADLDLGVLIQALRDSGRLDRSIVLLVADHGESLGDHGELLHGDGYFDTVVRVPLLLKVPGVDGNSSFDALVSHVDLMPTLLDLVGADAPAGLDGRSMRPLFEAGEERIRQTALVEGGVANIHPDQARGAVISPPWILIQQDRGCGTNDLPQTPGTVPTCLFHMEEDPGQTENRASTHPDVVQALTERWKGFRQARSGTVVPEALRLNPDFVELLQQSGYDFHPVSP